MYTAIIGMEDVEVILVYFAKLFLPPPPPPPPYNEVVGWGHIGFTPSVRPSIRPACCVCSVTPTVLDGFFPY